jgi:hypothetical protein
VTNPSLRLIYRIHQFINALRSSSQPVSIEELRDHLTLRQIALFQQMQPSEQTHAVSVLKKLQEKGHEDRDLLTAALLHDVGKITHPLSIWERVVIVIVKWLMPRQVALWGKGEPLGLRRSFVVAEQHAAWGATLALEAGASASAVEMIRKHHDLRGEHDSLYLLALQTEDDGM